MRIIIDCDFHPGYQQIAMMDIDSRDLNEKTLSHQKQEEVRTFYTALFGSVGGAVVLHAARRNGLCAVYSGFVRRRAWVIVWPQLGPSP